MPVLDWSSAPSDVVRCQWGWLPLKGGKEPGRPDALAERPRIMDHGRQGVRHLLSVEGVKFTTARLVAEQAVDRVFASLERTSPACRTAELRLPGAEGRGARDPEAVPAREEIVRAVRDEMAVNLTDIVFRRTALGAVPGPERATVEDAARMAGAELGWDGLRQEAEIDAVMRDVAVPGLGAGGGRVRILVLAPHPFFQARGTPLAVRTVLEFLSARGHQIDVLTFHEGEEVEISTTAGSTALPGRPGSETFGRASR